MEAMELNIIPIGNSDGIILPKSLMKKFSLKRHDVLVIPDDSPCLEFHKKAIDGVFFAGLPACPEAFGGNTETYLEMIGEEEQDD